MLEYNGQYETHPLYGHFKSWIDMEDNYQNAYFIMNTALYAAEAYIYNTYNVATKAIQIHEYFGDITEDKEYPKFNVGNLLAAYTNDGYVLPSIIYYNATSKTYEVSEGNFRLANNALTEINAINLNLDYITGYTYPEDVRYTPTYTAGTDDAGSEVTTPTISNSDGSPLYSPLSTMKSFYNLYIIGDVGATVYVNGVIGELLDASGSTITEDVSVSPTINDNRIGKVSLTLVDGINTFIITTKDVAENESKDTTIIINKQETFKILPVELCSKDLVTNDGDYKVAISSIPGSTIEINGVTLTTYSKGHDTLLPSVSTEGIQDVSIVVTSPAGVISEPYLTQVLYDSTLSDGYVRGINGVTTTDIVMPQDMLMAILMIANHYFRIALYKHEDTQSYGDTVSNRVTFNADRFPKEAHKILSRYLMY